MPLYNGTAAGFEVWAYRIGVKFGALNSVSDKDDKRQKLIEYEAHVIEGLSGNALLVAVDFGQDRLNRPDGVQALVELMCFANRESKNDDISELYRIGVLTTGLLCRRPGEPMASYVSRRSRWWVRIKELDPSLSLTESVLADNLLDCAGLTPDQEANDLDKHQQCQGLARDRDSSSQAAFVFARE